MDNKNGGGAAHPPRLYAHSLVERLLLENGRVLEALLSEPGPPRVAGTVTRTRDNALHPGQRESNYLEHSIS